SGRLRRKDNTLSFEPSATEQGEAGGVAVGDGLSPTSEDAPAEVEIGEAGADGMGDLALGPELHGEVEKLAGGERAAEEDAVAAPVRVGERRTIPVEDVDALWVFGELDLNARVLVFLAQHKVPVHFFN